MALNRNTSTLSSVERLQGGQQLNVNGTRTLQSLQQQLLFM